MRWGSIFAGLARGLTAALIAGPALAEPVALSSAASTAASKFSQSVWDAPPPRPTLRIALTESLELAATARKDKSTGEWFGRRADRLAGRPRNPRIPRVKLLMRW